MEEHAQEDAKLSGRILGKIPREDTGVLHLSNERDEKGGCLFDIPEYYNPEVAYPAVVALHGRSGHGRAFLCQGSAQPGVHCYKSDGARQNLVVDAT